MARSDKVLLFLSDSPDVSRKGGGDIRERDVPPESFLARREIRLHRVRDDTGIWQRSTRRHRAIKYPNAIPHPGTVL
jgi:hypothetical protein